MSGTNSEWAKVMKTGQIEARQVGVDLLEFWSIDELRKFPFDAEVVSRCEDRGYRVDEMYFTSEMTPKGPNRIFCAFARPIKPEKPLPVLLIIPGGGGHVELATALWAAQALKSMVMSVDWSGDFIPGTTHASKWRHQFPNPYSEIGRVVPDLKDNPLYHIVVALRRALDLISQEPDADTVRVALHGGSWGGYFSLLLAGIDSRVGCVVSWAGAGGWRDSHSGLSKPIEALPEDQRELWHATYDPMVYARRTKAAVLFVVPANDYYFWLGGVQEHYKALPGKKHLIITPNCDHGFGGPKLVDASWCWVKQYFTGKAGFPEIVLGPLRCNGGAYTCKARRPKRIASAKLYWSSGNVVWPGRYWVEIPAQKDGGKWRAEIPPEFAGLSGEVYVTVFTDDGLPASSTVQPRGGIDSRTVAGPLWSGNPLWDTLHGGIDSQTVTGSLWNRNALWDIKSGTDAWRPFGYAISTFDVTYPGSFKLGPAQKQTHFAVLTNSVVLASGRAPEYSGIRVKINGKGKEGKLTVRLCRDTRSNKEVSYGTIIDYQAGEKTVDLPWSAFKGPDGAPRNPYPFDGFVLEGDREDGSAFMVEAIELYK